jgi:hypothetical protein
MRTIVFFLEEPSAEEMLKGLLPRVLPGTVSFQCIPFHGKRHLEKSLLRRLRSWQKPDSMFVVIRDQDSGDCQAIKQKLVDLCKQAGKKETLVRIASQELESFYLGDLEAVEKGLNLDSGSLAKKQRKRKFRNPDTLGSPSQELERLTNSKYQKVSGSEAIGPHLKLEGNKSHSFNVLLDGIRRLVEEK